MKNKYYKCKEFHCPENILVNYSISKDQIKTTGRGHAALERAMNNHVIGIMNKPTNGVNKFKTNKGSYIASMSIVVL